MSARHVVTTESADLAQMRLHIPGHVTELRIDAVSPEDAIDLARLAPHASLAIPLRHVALTEPAWPRTRTGWLFTSPELLP